MPPEAAHSPAAGGRRPALELPASSSPLVTVVVTGWRSAPLLVDCLASIAAHLTTIPFEVVAALNEPTPELLGDLEQVEGLRVVSSPVNLGFAGICNLGAGARQGQHILFLNDDTEVLPDWFTALVETLDDESVDAAGSVNLDSDGGLQQAGAILWANGWPTVVSKQTASLLGGRFDPALPRRVDYCGASSLLVRGSTWDTLGGFDEEYFPAYFEDVDFCLRIAELGRSVLCQPRSRIVHHPGSSSTLAFREFVSAKNHARFEQLWRDLLSERLPFGPDDPEAVLEAIGQAARALPEPLSGPRTSPGRHLVGTSESLETANEAWAHRRHTQFVLEYTAHLEGLVQRLGDDFVGMSEQLEVLHGRSDELERARAELETEVSELRRQRDQLVESVAAFRRRRVVRLGDRLWSLVYGRPSGSPRI